MMLILIIKKMLIPIIYICSFYIWIYLKKNTYSCVHLISLSPHHHNPYMFFCHIYSPQFSHVLTTQIYIPYHPLICPVPSYLHAVPCHQPQHAALQLPPAAVVRSAGAGPWRQRGGGAVEEEPGFKWRFSHWKLQFNHRKLGFSHWKFGFRLI